MINENGTYRNCPFCGKQTNIAALLCPSCNKDISVFVPSVKITDKNRRHKAIKALMDLDRALFVSYSKLNLAFKGEARSIAEGISFMQGDKVKEELGKIGIEAEVKPVQLLKETAFQAVSGPTASKKFIDAVVWAAVFAFAFVLVYKYLLPNLREKPIQDPVADSAVREEPKSPEQIEENISKLTSSTVVIKGSKGSGSGFVITEDGYIITNNHVIANQYDISVRMEDGRTFVPEIVRTESVLDLALLKIDARDLNTLKIGDATKMKAGYEVWTIGAPKELAFTVNKGIISFVGRNINGIKYLQSDVAINPGNSGGPMINSKGEVIGINTFILTDSEGLNFALPINYIYSGQEPILAALPKAPVETKHEDFMPGEGDRITAVFDEPKKPPRQKPPSKPRSAPAYQAMMKELNERYERKKQGMDSDKETLYSSKSKIQERLNRTREQIEITEENTLADRITDLEIQIIEKDMEILEARFDYDNQALRILNQALNFSSAQSEKDSIERQRAMIKSEMNDLTEQIKHQRQKLEDIKSNRPGF